LRAGYLSLRCSRTPSAQEVAMLRRACAALTLLALAPLTPAADKPAVKKPLGTWVREVKGCTLTWAVQAETLTFTMQDEGTLKVHACYGVTPDGTLFACVTKVEKTGDAGPDKGELFSFRFKLEKGDLVVSGLKTTAGDGAEAKALVEGTYKKAKKE